MLGFYRLPGASSIALPFGCSAASCAARALAIKQQVRMIDLGQHGRQLLHRDDLRDARLKSCPHRAGTTPGSLSKRALSHPLSARSGRTRSGQCSNVLISACRRWKLRAHSPPAGGSYRTGAEFCPVHRRGKAFPRIRWHPETPPHQAGRRRIA